MKSTLKKLSAIFLVTALFLGLLVSCTTTTESTPPETPEITPPATPESTPPPEPEIEPPAEPESAPPPPVEIVDQLGRTVTLETTDPQRIVSLAPSNTEIIYALGLGDRLVGRTDYCNYPAEVEEITSIGGFSTPNIEEVVALAPDLVLADSIHKDEVIPQLESLGLTVVALAPATFDDVFDAIQIIGKVTGAEENTAKLLTEMRNRIKAVTDKTENLTVNEIPRVFYLVWHDPLMTSGGDTLINEMIEIAGGKNLFPEVSGAETVDLEVLVARNPQVIIAATGMGISVEITMDFLEAESRLNDTDAMKNGRVYGIHMDISGRTGPRIVDGLEEFAKAVHPELFDTN